MKQVYRCILVLAITLGSLGLPIRTMGAESPQSGPEPYAMIPIEVDVPANSMVAADTSFPMEAGETVRFRCSYSPSYAEVDFGLIASDDSSYYYKTAQNGSIDETVRISERDNYTFAIRNHSSVEVSFVGFIDY